MPTDAHGNDNRSPSPTDRLQSDASSSGEHLPPNPNHLETSSEILPVLRITSFGRKYGALDPKPDIQFNTQHLPIPPKEVRERRTGRAAAIGHWLTSNAEFRNEVGSAKARIREELRKAQEQGDGEVSVGVFCETGTHRSVCLAEELARKRWDGWETVLEHRDVEREPDGQVEKSRREASSRKRAEYDF